MNTRNSTKVLLLLLLTVGLLSCSNVIMSFYGMKNPKPIDDKTIQKFAGKYKIPESDSFKHDTAYAQFIRSMDSSIDPTIQKDHYQPLQLHYYNRDGELITYHNNCETGGFPNLKWDESGMLSTFPPQPYTPLSTLLPIDKHLHYLKPLGATERFDFQNYDYTVVVYWSRFMGRQSKRLVKAVQENADLALGKKVKVIYTNTDNVFAQLDLQK